MNLENAHKKNLHISSKEMILDIKDTQREIDNYNKQVFLLMEDRKENKLDIYLLEGRILKREGFIKDLETLLEFRNKLKNNKNENNI